MQECKQDVTKIVSFVKKNGKNLPSAPIPLKELILNYVILVAMLQNGFFW